MLSSSQAAAPGALLVRLSHLGSALHENHSDTAIWLALDQALAICFGHSLFTVLSFSPETGITRLYSTNEKLHPLGTRNKPPTTEHEEQDPGSSLTPPCRAAWVQRVIVKGFTWRGSTREDLRAAFEDWEQLWEVGLGSVLNIPVRVNGVTIGSLNILDKEHAYDKVDLDLGILIAQLVASFVDRVARNTAK